jgi:hypothetical protein
MDRYFSLNDDSYRMQMAAMPLGDGPIIEIDLEHYHHETTLKERELAHDYSYYFQELPGSRAGQWEVLELVFRDMARVYPEHFAFYRNGHVCQWHNGLLGRAWEFRYGDDQSLPLPPLDFVGRQVQEDLLLMSGDVSQNFPLIAGHLCFPSRWDLDEKLGKSFMAIHVPVPLFANQLGRTSQLMMERLKQDRPVWRANWSLSPTDQLDLSLKAVPHYNKLKAGINAIDAGDRVFFRIERQVLARLPLTNMILFTVRLYIRPISALANDPEWARRFASVLRSIPYEFLEYKGIPTYLEPLLDYLDTHSVLVEWC